MAGINAGFDGDAFRTAIRFVYDMAAPPGAGEAAVFYQNSTLVYNTPVDSEDTPFDPLATVTRTQPAPVTGVPCGVEYFDVSGTEIVFGTVSPATVKITLLDEDHDRVVGSDYVVIAGDKYLYRRTEAPSGLFDVGLWVLVFEAVDQP